MNETEKLLQQEKEIVRLRTFSHLKFIREAWFQPTTNPNNAMGAYTSLLDAEVVAYSIGGSLRRVWYLLRYDGDYLDGTSYPAAIDHIARGKVRLVTTDIGLRRPTPLALEDKPVSNVIIARERKYATECNEHHAARALEKGRERYAPKFPVAIVAATKKSIWNFWS